MSYEEYRGLFLEAQKNKFVPFKCFSFDLKNSSKMGNEERFFAQVKTYQTINLMTKKILELERKEDRQILLKNNEIKIAKDVVRDRPQITYYVNPCFTAGDSFHFYTYNGSIDKEEFLKLFKLCLKEVNNINIYHFASGNFETTKYNEGNKKYYVGYIIRELTDNKINIESDISIFNEQEFSN